MHFSYETASTWFDIANGFLVLALFIGVAATYLIYVTGNVKEEYVKEKLAESHNRSAKLEIEAASANERTATLEHETATIKKETAEANKRAAEANQKAEAERIERRKLELKLAPRSINPAQSKQLSAQLIVLQGIDVDIVSYEGMGADVAALSQQIAGALINAHINAKVFTPMGGGGVVRGILVRTEIGSSKKIEDAINVLVDSFKNVGLDAGRWDAYPTGEPIAGAYNGPGSSTAKLRILVGGKP